MNYIIYQTVTILIFALLLSCCFRSSLQYFSYIHDECKLTNNISCK